jgi:hypothetical protein
MLITFKTSAYANIIMFGDIGLELLGMMGFGKTVPSAIGVADVPQALENLQRKLDALPEQQQPVDADSDEPSDDPSAINLHTRAVPLLELLRAAIADEKAVRWE